jgi:serine/threonine protein kinase
MYRQLKQLGRGAFGEVWLCDDEEGNKVAVKFIPCHNIHGLNEASKEVSETQ